jgi:hypothetical protein
MTMRWMMYCLHAYVFACADMRCECSNENHSSKRLLPCMQVCTPLAGVPGTMQLMHGMYYFTYICYAYAVLVCERGLHSVCMHILLLVSGNVQLGYFKSCASKRLCGHAG